MRFFSDDKSIAEQSKSQCSLEVIGAGLPRCATSSLQAALESSHLGFSPSMHMARVIPHVDRAQLVIDALREKDRNRRQKLLYQIFDGFAATCDFPGVMFIDDLMDSMSFSERFPSSLRTRKVSAHSSFTKEVVRVKTRFKSPTLSILHLIKLKTTLKTS